MRKLYFGDNLEVLRAEVADETADLIYLDPPFNSKADYNLLFKSPNGEASGAQALAFEDTWSWGEASERAFREVIGEGGAPARLLGALRLWMQESDTMAYLAMMAARLVHLHRALKSEGSLYLHCDPASSHYLKILLDAMFGPTAFKSEIVWKRTSAHNSAKRWGPVHDTILFYAKGDRFTWNRVHQSYDATYLEEFYTHRDRDGRRWRRSDLTGAGVRHGATGGPWRGIDVTAKGRHWAWPPLDLETMDQAGKIHWPAKDGGMPMLKRYLDAQSGVAAQDMILDIPPLHNLAQERLGYPTQKPIALLDRILRASTNPGDVVLDPFCGCGTTVHAAEGLGRDWIGIDVTHYATTLIQARMAKAFPGVVVDVEGRPQDYESAQALAKRDKYQFQWWACDLIGAQRFRGRKKGADGGVDGEILFLNGPRGVGRIIVSVKGGDQVGVQAVRELRAVVDQQGADMGVLVSLADPTQPMRVATASAGIVRTAHGEFPRLQLAPLRDVFEGRYPRLPVPAPAAMFRPPPAIKRDRQMAFTFTFDGQAYKVPPAEDGVVTDPRLVAGVG